MQQAGVLADLKQYRKGLDNQSATKSAAGPRARHGQRRSPIRRKPLPLGAVWDRLGTGRYRAVSKGSGLRGAGGAARRVRPDHRTAVSRARVLART